MPPALISQFVHLTRGALSGTTRSAAPAPTRSAWPSAGTKPTMVWSEVPGSATASGSARSFTRRRFSRECTSRRIFRCSGTRHLRHMPTLKRFSPYVPPSPSRTHIDCRCFRTRGDRKHAPAIVSRCLHTCRRADHPFGDVVSFFWRQGGSRTESDRVTLLRPDRERE